MSVLCFIIEISGILLIMFGSNLVDCEESPLNGVMIFVAGFLMTIVGFAGMLLFMWR